MDSSDKEIIKDDLPEEETEMDENHSQIKNEETCQDNEVHYTTVNSSVKRKLEPYFQNQRKRSTDNVRKESDDNLTDCSKIQDTDLAEGHSRKNDNCLSPVRLPCIRITCVEENSKQADRSITEVKNIKISEESNSALQDLKASIMKYFSNVIDQSESDRAETSLLKNTVGEICDNIINILKSIRLIVNPENVTSDKPKSENIIDPQKYEVQVSSKDDTKNIDENLFEKEQVADNEQSKLVVSEKICTKCKQDGQLRPSISPGKRKSLEIVVDEIKRKRYESNAPIKVQKDENITCSSNVQDSALNTGHSIKSEKHVVNTVISTSDKAQGCVKEQGIAINQTDQSSGKYKITETTGEAEYKTRKRHISKSENTPDQTQSSDKILLLEDSIIRSTLNRSTSFIERSFDRSLLDNVKECQINPRIEIGEDSTSEDALKDYIKDIATENFSKLRDLPESPESKLQRKTEDISVKFPIKMSNTKTEVSCDIPVNLSRISADTSKSANSNISKSRENTPSEETMPPPQGIIGGNRRRRISRFSPAKLFSDTECGLNPPYIEPESQNTNVEQMKNDPEIVEQQKKILESIYRQRQQTSSMKPESQYQGKFLTSLSNKALELHESQERILGSTSHQRQHISSMKPKSDDEGKYAKPSQIEGPNEMSPEMSKRVYSILQRLEGVFKSEGKDVGVIPTPTIIKNLIELAEIYDPDIIPYIPCYIMKVQKCMRQLQEENKTLYDKSTNESLEKNDRAINPIAFVDASPDKNPLSPISSPPKSEPDKISETDSSEFREYPGLAEDPTNVKKDARYQKKFYKSKKPVTLPVNWSGDKASSSKIELNIDSEDKIQRISDDPRTVSGNDDDTSDEKSHENPKIILKNEDLLKEKSENTLLGQEPAEAKKDQRFYRLEPVLLPINRREDGGSSEMEPNIDSDKNEIQRIGDDQQIVFRNSEDSVHEESEKDPKTILLKDKDMFKETGKSPDDKPSGTSVSVSEYKTSLFTEGSPDSSQSNSPIRNNESTLQSVLEIIPQIELLAERSTSISSQISSSQARPSDSPDSQVRSSQSNKD